MLHGWTEYDAVAMERQMFNAKLDAQYEQQQILSTEQRLRATVASALVAFAARLAPTTTVERPRRSTAAHA